MIYLGFLTLQIENLDKGKLDQIQVIEKAFNELKG
jgi:hypothetical protein